MEQPQTRNSVWTTSNGYLDHHHRPSTPGSLSVRTALPPNGTPKPPHNRHPLYNPHLVGVQSKFRRKYYHKTLLCTLILLIVILLVAIIVINVTHKKPIPICNSQECIRTAASLIYSMDQETDPCEDFYEFTCGRWSNEHPRPDSVTSNDWFRERQSHVMRTLRRFLQSNVTDKEPVAVGKAKMMYKACMNTQLMDKLGLEPLVRLLLQFELPLLPTALNVTITQEKLAKYGNSVDFNWLNSLVLIKKILGIDLIIGFDIFPDPLNRTLNRIALGTPEADSALPFNNDENRKLMQKIWRHTIFNTGDSDDAEDHDDAEEEAAKQTSTGLAAYIAYIKQIIQTYIAFLDPDAVPENIEESAAELAIKTVKVAKVMYKLKAEAENSTKPSKGPELDILYISVAELQNDTDKLIAPKTLPIWKDYLRLMLKDSKLTENMITDDFKIVTSKADIQYLQLIAEYLVEVPPMHIEFYIWLSIVEELVLHTTSELRLLHTEYMRVIVGTEGSTPRSLYCSHGINSLMGMAVSYALVDDDFTTNKLPNVERMLHHIRHSFDNLVKTTSWMDAGTKHVTLQKSAKMKSFIGFPGWLANSSALNEHYEGVKVNESMHLENMVSVLRWQMMKKLDKFNETEPSGWATSPSNVNAFHTFQSNAITIPIAILQFPFYDLGLEEKQRTQIIEATKGELSGLHYIYRVQLNAMCTASRALNYGSIGTILGHELTHGFDDSGRMFDKNGNMVQWWSNETITEYINRTECFIEQYNRYYLADVGEYIDGELTLGENIADNGGMREAYYAYRMYVSEMGKEQERLPGLEQFTHEQLFFISFGNLWCEAYTPAASRYALEDSHCPGKMRLKGVLSNSEEFARTFNCPKGSGMNPKQQKCRIW